MGSQEISLDFKGSHGVSVAGARLYQFIIWLVGWFPFFISLLLFRIWELLSACSSIQSHEKTISPRWTHLRQLQLVQIPRKPNLNTTLIFNVERLAKESKNTKIGYFVWNYKRAGWRDFGKFCLSSFFLFIDNLGSETWMFGLKYFKFGVCMQSHLLPLPLALICNFFCRECKFAFS